MGAALEEMPEIVIFRDSFHAAPGMPILQHDRFDLTLDHDQREEFRQRYESMMRQYAPEQDAYFASLVIDELLQDAVDHAGGRVLLFNTVFPDHVNIIAITSKEYDPRKKRMSMYNDDGSLYTAEFGANGSYPAEHGRGSALIAAIIEKRSGDYKTADFGKSTILNFPISRAS